MTFNEFREFVSSVSIAELNDTFVFETGTKTNASWGASRIED